MFTGIVEEAGVIEKITPSKKSIEMTVRASVCGKGVKVGDSVAVNGCCLTAVKITSRGRSKLIRFDLLQESWRRNICRTARNDRRGLAANRHRIFNCVASDRLAL